jgi:hypothetical protein
MRPGPQSASRRCPMTPVRTGARRLVARTDRSYPARSWASGVGPTLDVADRGGVDFGEVGSPAAVDELNPATAALRIALAAHALRHPTITNPDSTGTTTGTTTRSSAGTGSHAHSHTTEIRNHRTDAATDAERPRVEFANARGF